MGCFLDVFAKGSVEQFYGFDKVDVPIKLIEPSIGRIVELEVTEKDEHGAKLYMDMLIAYVKSIEQYGAKYVVMDSKIKITFEDGKIAQKARQTFKK